MRYIKRSAEEELGELSKSRAAVLVAGPRQVGKTTLLEKYTKGIDFVSLSNSTLAEFADNHGHTFLETYRPPIFIDDVQKAPNIFEAIKLCIDTEKKKGLFYLCGSQQIDVMKGVTESLAGRIGLINLQGLSLRELYETGVNAPFVPTEEYFNLRNGNTPTISYDDAWEIIFRGSMPELCVNPDLDLQKFYENYLSAYIQSDVREIINLRNDAKFGDFLIALAEGCGQILNVAALSKSTGINVQTAEKWLSVLVNTKIIYLLRPYRNEYLDRLYKTPKVYFSDTGLCAYLCGMTTPKQIQTSSMRGAIFENFVISEIIKGYYNNGYLKPPLFYYRDAEHKEIDLVISDGEALYPIEIKSHVDPHKKDIASFGVLDDIPGKKRGPGGVVCMFDRLMTMDETEVKDSSGGTEKIRDRVIPVTYI